MTPEQIANVPSGRRVQVVALNGGIDLSTPAIARVPGTLLDAVNFFAKPQGGGYERYAGYRRVLNDTNSAFLPDGWQVVSHPECFVIESDLYFVRAITSGNQVSCQIFQLNNGNVHNSEGGVSGHPVATVDSGNFWVDGRPDGKVRCQVMVTNFSGFTRQRAFITFGGLMEPVVFDPAGTVATVTAPWQGDEGYRVSATFEQERDADVEDHTQQVAQAWTQYVKAVYGGEDQDNPQEITQAQLDSVYDNVVNNPDQGLQTVLDTAQDEVDNENNNLELARTQLETERAGLNDATTRLMDARAGTVGGAATDDFDTQQQKDDAIKIAQAAVNSWREAIDTRTEIIDGYESSVLFLQKTRDLKKSQLDQYDGPVQQAYETLLEKRVDLSKAQSLNVAKSRAAVIQTFQQNEYPTHLARHADRLVLGFKSGSVLIASADTPLNFNVASLDTGLTGTTVLLSTGESVEGMVGDFQGGLVILGRHTTSFLTGRSSSDFAMRRLSTQSGGKPNSMQMMETPICLDDRGLRGIQATDRYGDLLISTVSEAIRPIVDQLNVSGRQPTASVVVRSKNQYRVFYDTGDVLVGVFTIGELGTVVQWTRLIFKHRIMSAVSYEDDRGVETVYMADDQGNIFQSDVGNTMDGEPVECFMEFANLHMDMPNHFKRIYRVEPIVSSGGRGVFDTAYVLDFGTKLVLGNSFQVSGVRKRFDREKSLIGTGSFGTPAANWKPSGSSFVMRNMSLLISGNKQVSDPFEISGFTVDYSVRGLNRSKV